VHELRKHVVLFLESRGKYIAPGESAVETWGHAYGGTVRDALAPYGVHAALLVEYTLHSLSVVVGSHAFQAKASNDAEASRIVWTKDAASGTLMTRLSRMTIRCAITSTRTLTFCGAQLGENVSAAAFRM
jgi:hypothetical protein